MNDNPMFPPSNRESNEKMTALAPEHMATWRNFSKAVFKAGALDEKTKQLIAVSVAHVTQCPYCIRGHTRGALIKGASKEEIMEAIWIAAAGRASSSYSHAALSVDQMDANDGHEGSNQQLYTEATPEMAAKKAKLAPEIVEEWRTFMNTVFKAGLLSTKTKQLIALAIAHVTQCAYCIKGHTKNAKVKGASNEEMMEAIWVAAEMRSGAAYAHATIALDEMDKFSM